MVLVVRDYAESLRETIETKGLQGAAKECNEN
jgi:hypothetical protein